MGRAATLVYVGRWIVMVLVFVVAVVVAATSATHTGPGDLGFAGGDLASYAVINISGAKTVHLPSGTVDVSFDALTGDVAAMPLPQLSLGVHPVGGGADPKVTVARSDTINSGGESETRAAEIHVVKAGDYRVSITGGGNYNAPRLLLGRSTAARWLPILIIAAVVDLAIFLLSVVTLQALRRRGAEPALDGSQRTSFSIELPHTVSAAGGAAGRAGASDGHRDGSVEDRLAHLDRLHQAGTVSDDEYAAERQRIRDSL